MEKGSKSVGEGESGERIRKEKRWRKARGKRERKSTQEGMHLRRSVQSSVRVHVYSMKLMYTLQATQSYQYTYNDIRTLNESTEKHNPQCNRKKQNNYA